MIMSWWSGFCHVRTTFVALLGMAAVTSHALAGFPDRPITLKLGFSAGGSSDISARAFLQVLEKYLPAGSTVVVGYKARADGLIMGREVAASKPDGYPLGLLVSPNAISVLHEGKNVHYNVDSYD